MTSFEPGRSRQRLHDRATLRARCGVGADPIALEQLAQAVQNECAAASATRQRDRDRAPERPFERRYEPLAGGDFPSFTITCCRSDQTSRLADGVRSRYAGWKVGITGMDPR